MKRSGTPGFMLSPASRAELDFFHEQLLVQSRAEMNRLRGAYGEKALGLSAERAPRASLRDLELKLGSERDRTVSKVVEIPTEVSAVQTVNRNSVIILIEGIQEIGAHDELAHLVKLDML